MLVIQLLVAAIPVFIVGYIAYEAGLRDGKRRQKMVEFEKWYKNSNSLADEYCSEPFELAWKAALEWVLGINSIYSDCNRECFTLQDIRKELDATSEKRC